MRETGGGDGVETGSVTEEEGISDGRRRKIKINDQY